MHTGPITRIVVQRPDGKTEVVGRAGTLEPYRLAREFTPNNGTVTAVRHEQGGKTMAIFALEKPR